VVLRDLGRSQAFQGWEILEQAYKGQACRGRAYKQWACREQAYRGQACRGQASKVEASLAVSVLGRAR